MFGLVVVPVGVVTLIGLGSEGSKEHSILYPGGKKVLKPWIKLGCPRNKVETRSITPGVSILCSLKSFIMSKKLLYTSAWL